MIPAPVGEGKTAMGLLAILDSGRSALVISTKFIIEETWPKEIEEWGFDLSYAAFSGSKGGRMKALSSKPRILGVSFDNLVRYYAEKDPVERTICIIDESTAMKAPPMQAKRVAAQIKNAPRFKQCYALSATPAPEGALGLWSQFACVMKERPLGTIGQFRQRYFEEIRRPTHTEWKIRPDGLRGISRALAPYFFPIPPLPPGRFGIPEPREIPIPIEWSDPACREEYEAFAADDLDDENEFERMLLQNPGVKQNKLRQLASGFLYREDSSTAKRAVYADKTAALARYLERIGEEPLLVFVQFTEEMRQIQEAFPQAQLGLDAGVVARWSRREIPMLVVHPSSAGKGLNLQFGGHHILFYSMPWGFEPWHQSIGRLHRRGQTRQVHVAYFMRRDSIEERIRRSIERKQQVGDEIVGELTLAAS